MIQMRSALWWMLFTGVIVHMLCCTSLYIAITSMVKQESNSQNETSSAACVMDAAKFNSTSGTTESKASEGEFEWASKDVDVLKSSFTWLMGTAQLIGGVLCQKFGGKITFGVSNLLMGILTCLIPLVAEVSIIAVIVVRVLQGFVGGAAIGNTANVLISKWVPPDERGKFSTVMAGLYCGTAFSYFLHGWVLYWFGWRAVFYVSSIIACAWCIVWQLVVYDSPQEHPYISADEINYIEKQIGNSVSKKKLPIPWKAILTSRPIIVNTLCQVGSMWTIFTFTLYIPSYLKEIHGFPSYMIGIFSSLPYMLETIFAIGFSIFTDYLLHRKILSRTATRKFAASFSTIVAGILFGSLVLGGCNVVYILIILTLAVMFNGASSSGIGPNVIDLSPNFCAVLHGIQGFITSSTGYVSPLLIALLTDKHKTISEWNIVFIVTSVLNILPGILFLMFGESEVQSWNNPVNYDEKFEVDEKLIKSTENGASKVATHPGKLPLHHPNEFVLHSVGSPESRNQPSPLRIHLSGPSNYREPCL